jgi:hypothetical protein
LLLLAGYPTQLVISWILGIIDLGMTKTELAVNTNRAPAEISQFIHDFSTNSFFDFGVKIECFSKNQSRGGWERRTDSAPCIASRRLDVDALERGDAPDLAVGYRVHRKG